MKKLLSDIERGRVDAVVAYKLDRLSRSQRDFVRLMDVFSTIQRQRRGPRATRTR